MNGTGWEELTGAATITADQSTAPATGPSDPTPGTPSPFPIDLTSVSPGPIDSNASGASVPTLFGGGIVDESPVTITEQDTGSILASLEGQPAGPSLSDQLRSTDVLNPDTTNADTAVGWDGLTNLFSNLGKVAGSVAQGVRNVQGAVSGQPAPRRA